MEQDKSYIYAELEFNRRIVVDPQSGEWAGNIAWRRIDELLDCLNALNQLGDVAKPVPVEFF